MAKKRDQIEHERLFKELLQNFFEEFLVLFFPSIYEEIDFAHMTFLDKEFVNDTARRERKEVDVIVGTKLKGEDSLIYRSCRSPSLLSIKFQRAHVFLFHPFI